MTTTKSRKSTKLPCVTCTGLGERDPYACTCRDNAKGRSALRAVFDNEGRWLVQWREKDGEEWVGTYRLIPC